MICSRNSYALPQENVPSGEARRRVRRTIWRSTPRSTILMLITGGLWLIVVIVRVVNREIETLVVTVDASGVVHIRWRRAAAGGACAGATG